MVRILSILTFFAVLTTSVSTDAATRTFPRQKEGDYVLTVGGLVSGTGTASVTGDQLTMNAEVATEGGVKGQVTGTFTLTNNHFAGTGTVMGQSATFKGRIDQPDDVNERTIKGVRLTCTFKTGNGEYGRIIGNLPSPPRTIVRPPGGGTTRPTTGGGTGTGTGGGTTKPDDKPDTDPDDDDRLQGQAPKVAKNRRVDR